MFWQSEIKCWEGKGTSPTLLLCSHLTWYPAKGPSLSEWFINQIGFMSFKYRFLNVISSPFKLITTEPTTNVKNKKKSFYYTTVQSHYRLTQDNITAAALVRSIKHCIVTLSRAKCLVCAKNLHKCIYFYFKKRIWGKGNVNCWIWGISWLSSCFRL